MKRLIAMGVVVLLGACTPGGNEPENSPVTNALKTLDTQVRKAERSTATFFATEPFSQHAKITFQEAYRDWGQVRFQARLAFTPADLERDEKLRSTVTAVVSAADAWVDYLEFIESSVEGEAPVDTNRANQMLVNAKKRAAIAKSVLQGSLQGTSD